MKRREFLKTVGVATGAVTGAGIISGVPAVLAQSKFKWKMVTS